MVPPRWITASDLNEWANRANRQAQEKLPELLRRLVHATVQRPRKVDFPAGDSIHMAGWDGVVEVLEGNFIVPDGCSGWEMGVSKDFRKKANNDYRTRCRDPLGLNPVETTFVFVTPRRWKGKGKSKEDWEREKNREGIWAKVRAYDADDLEQWLEVAPAVHAWFARLLGKWTEDAQDLESFWEEWSGATKPALIPQLYLAGREQALERVQNWLAASPSKLTIQADSREEAIAFFAAAILQLPEELREKYLSKCVILENQSSWRNFSNNQNPLILIPKFEQPEFVPKEHHVLIPIGHEFSSQNALQLDRPDRTALQQVLVEMGFSRHRAYALVEESKRSLLVLRHLRMDAPNLPNWAKPEHARLLIPVLLAGAWDGTKQADRDIVSQLANKPYEEVTNLLMRWVNNSDPLIQQTGNVWQVISREVAWHYLSGNVFPDDLERLKNVALAVLEMDDPRYELPVEQRFAAAAYDQVLPHSDLLRQGLANTLAILAARGLPKATQDSRSAQSRVDEIVRKLLRGHSNWKRWASLANLLPTLAEAAPDEFLSAVEAGLRGDQPPVLQLFLEEEPWGSPHTGLLWALELLAWNLEYLGRVVLILAKLSRLDPGGKLVNRPFRSLCEIFLCWYPQTLATQEQRFQIIDELLRREPQIAWDLLCCLLPVTSTISFPTHKPRWRDWDTDYTPQVTRTECQQNIDAIVNRLLANVGNDCERLCHLIEKIDSFPKQGRNQVIDYLHTVDIASMQLSERAKIWDNLRETIYHHRNFSGSSWALPAEDIDRLYALYQKLEPKGSVYHYAWLFSFNPSLLETIEAQQCKAADFQDYSFSLDLASRIEQDWEAKKQKIQQTQDQAVKDAYLQGGVALLLTIANHAVEPCLLGRAIARIEKIAEVEAELLSVTMGNTNKALSELAVGFIQGRFKSGEWNWVEQMLAFDERKQWFPPQTVSLLPTLPICQRTMDLLASFEEEVQNLYWQIVSVNWIISQDDHEVAIRKLLEVNRPYTTLDLVGLILRNKRESRDLSPTLLIEVLEKSACSTSETEVLTKSDCHHYKDVIEKIFYELDQSDVENSEIARLEWVYLPLLKQTLRQPKLLCREISKDPLFFAEILEFVYPSEDDRDESSQPDEEAVTRANLGRELLESWYQVPGLTEEGTIDSEELKAWVSKAREACYANSRGKRGDYEIGRILAYVPKAADGIYPNPIVREIIEKAESEDLEQGIISRLWNKRETAETFRSYAAVLQTTDYKTAAMLKRLASIYDSDAHREEFE